MELGPAQPKLAGVTAHQIRFRGLDDAPIAGWLVRPDGTGPFPGVAHYHGYGGRAAHKEPMVFPCNGHEITYDIEERRLRELVRRLGTPDRPGTG